nr:AbrB/MazE/SpoVT family DNA-binding domain-containing protein [Clostridia bacterium]
MLTELRDRSQITIPASVTKQLGLSKGDKFEIIVKDGGIFLCPVVVLTKRQMEHIDKMLKDAEKGIDKQPEFDNIDDMLKYLKAEE